MLVVWLIGEKKCPLDEESSYTLAMETISNTNMAAIFKMVATSIYLN
jgi:hypothetical protein